MVSPKFEVQVKHILFFGVGKCFSHQATKALPNGIVESFYVGGLSSLFSCFLMSRLGQTVVCFPEVRKAVCFQVTIGQLTPKSFTGLHRTIANEEGDDLAGLSTKHNPNPDLPNLQPYIGEHLVYLQYRFWPRRPQAFLEGG